MSGPQPFSARVPPNRKKKSHAPPCQLGKHFMAFSLKILKNLKLMKIWHAP